MKLDSSTIKTALRAAEQPLLLETGEQLIRASSCWNTCSILGIDTEFLRERTYRAKLGLVQVSDGVTAWLIDTIEINDLAPLQKLLSNKRICKILHSGSEDLEVLWHTLRVIPKPMVDTQIACAMLGQPLQMSYTHAVKWLADIEVDKELTRSNWIHRPLKPEQLHYAATDVVFLPAMYEQLRSALNQSGRWPWLLEEVERMASNSTLPPDIGQAYMRINGGRHLDRPSLHVLKALAAWREESAARRNIARGFVVPDSVLLQLAIEKPRTRSALLEIRGLHPKAVQRHQQELLKVIEDNLNLNSPIQQATPLDRRQRRVLSAMRKLVQHEASALGMDPALLASKKQLESILHAIDAGVPVPERMSGWREPIITRKLLELAATADSG